MTIPIKEVLDMIEAVSIDYANNVSAQKALDDIRKGVESKLKEIDKGMEKTYETNTDTN
jgi:hypothetical protein